MTQYTVSSGHTSTGITLGLNDTMYVQSGGKAVKTTITSGGYLSISAGGSASGSKIGSSGREDDYGTDSGATVNNGGKLGVYGSATSATVNSGGIENIWSDAKDSGATLSGGIQYVNNGGTAIDTIVDNGGWQSDGYIASGTIINNGGSQTVSDSATSTTINNGGLQIVEGDVIATTVNNGGSQTVLAGTATSTTVENGGVELLSGATAQASGTVLDGGTLQVDSGVILGTTINAAGSVVLGSDGSASGTIINAGGSDTVSGLEYAAQISGGTQTVVAGGTVSGSVVYAGGTLNISAGGTALGIINSGGTINDYGSMTLPVFQVGAETIDTGGTATDPTLYGGTMTLDGGTVTDPTIDGGTFDYNDGTLNGPIQLNANTTLEVSGTTMPTSTIDVSTSDTIFLPDVPFDPNGSATIESGNVVQISEMGELYKLRVEDSQPYTPVLEPYEGGTEVKIAPPATGGYIKNIIAFEQDGTPIKPSALNVPEGAIAHPEVLVVTPDGRGYVYGVWPSNPPWLAAEIGWQFWTSTFRGISTPTLEKMNAQVQELTPDQVNALVSNQDFEIQTASTPSGQLLTNLNEDQINQYIAKLNAETNNINSQNFDYQGFLANCQTGWVDLCRSAGISAAPPTDLLGNVPLMPGAYMPMPGFWAGAGKIAGVPTHQPWFLPNVIFQYLSDKYAHLLLDTDPHYNTIPAGSGSTLLLIKYGEPLIKSLLIMSSNLVQEAVAAGVGAQNLLPTIAGFEQQATALTNSASSAASQVAPSAGSPVGNATLDGSQGNQLLIGFGGNNTLIGGGNDDLFGGVGANNFVFGQTALSAAQGSTPATTSVLDFDQDGGSFSLSQGDTINVAAIVGTAYSQGNAAGSLVRAIEDPSGNFANLEVNPTGRGAWTTIAELQGLSLGDPVDVVVGTSGAVSQIDVQVTTSTISPAFATGITPSVKEAEAGQAVTFMVTMNEAVAVSSVGGLPMLTLSDGGTATYDVSASKPASGTLVFDYTVGTSTPDLEVSSVSATGVTAVSGGAVADLSPIESAYTGLQVGAAFVTQVTASNYGAMSADGDLLTGQAIEITVAMSQGVIVNTSKGSPFLVLNDNGTASYDPTASDPASGNLVFDYTPAAGDYTTALAVDALNLNGATVVDSNGVAIDPSGAAQAVNFPMLGLASDSTTADVNATILRALTTSLSGEVDSGQTVRLTLQMSGAVSVNSAGGLPTLTLNDGATATYDAAASSPATGALVFDYTVGSGDATSELSVDAVNLPTGTAVLDANGNPVDFSSATDLTTNLQIGPTVVDNVAASQATARAGQTVALSVNLGEGVSLNATGGNPTLTLSNNATAIFDATASNLATGTLVFDYTVGATGQTANLEVTQVNLPSGTTVKDLNGVSVDFSAADDALLGLSVDTPLTVTGVTVPQGIVGLALHMSEAVTVNTTTGTPTLTLNDGSTATYDAAESTSTELVFDRDIEPYFQASNLAVTQVNLNGTTVQDVNGYNADFSGALNVGTGIQETASVAVLSSVAAVATFVDNGAPVQLAPALTLADTTSGTLDFAEVSVSTVDNGTAFPADDILAANTAGTAITANYDSVDEILFLSGTDTLADYQRVLRSVTFSTLGEDPTISGADQTRTVSWTVNENPNPSITTVNIIPSTEILFRDNTTGDTGFYQMINGALAGWQDVGASSPAYSAVGTGDFTGTDTDDILYRNNSTGDTGFYTVSNGANTGWSDIGASSTAYSIVGIGDFTGNGTDDILYRDNATGDTGFYTISNGVNTGWSDVGASSTAYSVVGVGDFTGSGTDDILYRDNSNGDTGFYTMSNGVNTGWSDVGASSTAYSVVGVGDFMGTGTDDILYRDNTTGDTGFYAISNGVNTGWHDIGPSSTAYSVVGVGDYLGNGSSDILYRDNTTGDTGFYAIVNGVNTGWHDVGVSSSAYHVVS
jgi:autotransporter passenger strand-loop-strand repeat protein